MGSHRYAADPDALAGRLTRWSGTAATTLTLTSESSGSGASTPSSPVEATCTPRCWVKTGGG